MTILPEEGIDWLSLFQHVEAISYSPQTSLVCEFKHDSSIEGFLLDLVVYCRAEILLNQEVLVVRQLSCWRARAVERLEREDLGGPLGLTGRVGLMGRIDCLSGAAVHCRIAYMRHGEPVRRQVPPRARI
jgi:hypothetical protein